MAHFKLVVSDRTGKSTSKEIKDISAQPLLGSKLGDILDSSVIGVGAGKMKITGGSDKSGTPMRAGKTSSSGSTRPSRSRRAARTW